MSMESIDCRNFLIKNKFKFGIADDITSPEYLDICTQNVKCIATKQVKEFIPLPSINHILNNCRGIVDYPGEIDTNFASFRVTSAKEELVHCNTNNPGVRIMVDGQIVVRTTPKRGACSSYIAIPVKVVDEVLYDFYSTKDGDIIHCLKDMLGYIDGSCMVVQLKCRIAKEMYCGVPRYVAKIKGTIADKLWKRENIWVEGIKAYSEDSLTFCDDFMATIPCPEEPSMDSDCFCDDNKKDDDDECHHHHDCEDLLIDEF